MSLYLFSIYLSSLCPFESSAMLCMFEQQLIVRLLFVSKWNRTSVKWIGERGGQGADVVVFIICEVQNDLVVLLLKLNSIDTTSVLLWGKDQYIYITYINMFCVGLLLMGVQYIYIYILLCFAWHIFRLIRFLMLFLFEGSLIVCLVCLI